ncbi:hypothetical protein DM02DRAFT_618496 [Periconia macrospinosa]|uniref:Zn(2)-C6 fungal-type domain-containing protein n=1 Tax=Periconia macrospinosa TaxID=97972 RepID=A0A2V1DBS2_9PLEO|nr:hypothetical protein DM02DRAFT_618496 [Periconia macrospinosa]
MIPHTSGPKSSAAYGHACSNCVKAKCKCVPRDDGNSCERCHRLVKECHPSTSVRKRAAKRPNPCASKTSKLEDKLDNLVSLLQAQHNPNSNRTTPSPAFNQLGQFTTELPSRLGKLSGPSDDQKDSSNTYLPSPSATSPPSSCQSRQFDAGQVIDLFTKNFLVHFPFLHIPKEQPIDKFIRERPMTFEAISVLCEFSGERQKARAKSLREQIALRVIARSERGIDLLLATLACTIWQVFFTSARPDTGMWSSICGALIKDMRLVKNNVPFCISKVPPLYDMPESKEASSDEERRAIIACYIINAIVSAYIKPEPLPWSPYVEEICRALMLNQEISGDRILIALVRVYKISIEASKVIKSTSEAPHEVSAALMQVKLLRTMLEQAENELGQDERQSRAVQTSLHTTSTLVHEAIVIIASTFNNTTPMPDPSINLQCITYLSACLHSCKSALESFTGMRFGNVNLSMVFAWMHALQILFKLSVLDYPNWDRSVSRATADPVHYISRSLVMMQAAHEELRELGGSSETTFSKAPEIMKAKIGVWKEQLDHYDAMAAATTSMPISTSSSSIPAMEGGLGQSSFDSGNLAMGFDFMDTSWLTFSDEMFFPNIFA